MLMSQILKFLDFTRTQKSRYFENKTLFFLQIKQTNSSYIKGYFMVKNSFVAEVNLTLSA